MLEETSYQRKCRHRRSSLSSKRPISRKPKTLSFNKTSQQVLLNDTTSPTSILTPPAISSFSFGLEDNSELDSLLEKLEKYSQHVSASCNSSSLVCVQNKENVDHVGTPSQSHESVLLLSNWGLPTKVVEQYEKSGVSSMFPWQAECLLLPNVLSGGNLVFSAPTSAGKTLVAELLTLKCVLERHKKVLFILPFVSIGQEKTNHFQKLFGCVNVKTGGFIGGQSPAGGLAAVDIAVCTIEKANSIVNQLLEKGELAQVGAVVIDELHMIGEPHRGFLLELLITKILYASSSSGDNSLSEQKNHIQLIGMSATLPNVHMLSCWIGGELFITQYRPVALEEMVFVGGTLYNACFDKLRSFSNAADEEGLAHLCQETITEGHSVLVFCPTRSWCESLAKKLANVITCQEDDSTIAAVYDKLKQTMVGVDPVLKLTLSRRVAFHHAGLTVDERVIIETAFRQGIIKLLIATSTLSSGVNLPARRVIIRTPTFYGKLIDVQVYRQMAGRAGRKGVDTKGESILICKQSEKSKVADLLKSELRPVHSCIGGGLVGEGSCNPTAMSRALLEVIVSGTASTFEDVMKYASSTLLFAEYVDQKDKSDSTNQNDLIKTTLEFLITNEFIALVHVKKEEIADVLTKGVHYRATQLGMATVASALSPTDALWVFSELSKARKNLALENELHLLYQVTPIHIQQQWPSINWYQYLKIWEGLSDDMKHVASLVGVQEVFLIRAINQRITTRTAAQQAAMSIHLRFLISLALHDLVHEVPLPVVAEKFGTSKGLLQSLQLSAGGFAGMVTIFCQKLGWSNLELLFAQFQSRLVFGVERELCDIIRVSLLSNYQARTLYNAGYHTLTSIASASPTAVEICLRSATPFHCAKVVEDSEKTATLKERLDEAEMIVKEAQKLISVDLGIPIESWQPKLTGQINKVESSETKRSQLKRSPLRETKSLKKIKLHLTSPDVTSTSGSMFSDIPPQAQSTPSLGKTDTGCSKVDHSAQIISPEQVMAQSPLLIDEVSCVKEEFSEVMFGEVSSTSCDMSIQLITPQVTDVSVVAESPLQQSFCCDASGDVAAAKPHSLFESENVLNMSNKVLLNDMMTTKSGVLGIAKHSSCCITVKKVTNTELDSTIKELAQLQTVSISVATEAMKVGQGIGENLRGHGKVQQMSNSLPIPLLHCGITGVAIYTGGLHVYYISIQSNNNLSEILSSCICHSSFRKKVIAFDVKKHAKLLSSGFNVDLSGATLLDPSIAHWLTNPDGKQLSLQQLLSRHLPEVSNLSLEDGSRRFSLSLKGNSNQLKTISECVTSFLLMNKLQDVLVAEELYNPFVTIEMPSILCLAKMELNGVGVCQEQCALYKARLQNHLHKLEQKAHKVAEQKFSLSSPGEVARVLFMDLKLPVDDNRSAHSKFTMKQLSHISTCKEVLEKLSMLHPLPAVIMEWRTVAMTLSTVINPLEREIVCSNNKDLVRIYATCHTHTATGRVTIAKPNLQSVPRDYQLCYEGDTSGPLPADQHTGVSIRNMFIAAPGCVLLSADYSQLELRIMAHLSGDECLHKALAGDQDVFKVMASDWLGIPLPQLTDQHRQQAKSICYGLMYGMGTKSLATQLKIPESEASDLVETFKNCYPGVKSFMSDTIQLCKTKGYVVMVAGRKRFLPAIHSVDKSAQSQAERQAVNTVIQGSAADLVKMATINIDCHLKRTNDSLTRLVLQLHDELLYECDESRAGEVSKIVAHEMSTVLKKTKITFPVKLKIGCSWGSLHTAT